jgi:hypothetical protein
MKSRTRALALVVGCVIAPLLSAFLAACGGSAPPPRQVSPVVRDVPPILRGTIGTEVDFRGIEPVLVSGYGIVVGLNGTGGDVLPDNIAATMEREMGLRGIGKAGSYEGTAIEGKTPRQMLRDKNVAVVLVQAAIPPGSPAGASFDVFVRAINASSLEGGTLWTTDLRLGDASTFGKVQARLIATSRGPVFINPFAEPGSETAGITKTVGRVLDGGRVTNPFEIEMVLLNASHARARSIVSAINSRFPQGPGDPGTTARGRSSSSIELRVPTRFRTNPADFLQLIRHLQIDQSYPEEYARRYVEGLKAEPMLGEELSWCLESLGSKAMPFVREVYDYPELVPQMSALRAGARLGDPQAVPHLNRIARGGGGGVKTQAIRFLGEIDAGPTVDESLKELLNEEELSVRVAAYEALAGRAKRAQVARLYAMRNSNPELANRAVSPTHVEILAEMYLPGRSIQGIERWFVANKFFVDTVPGGEPMVYITQQGQPRVVLFGERAAFRRPSLVTLWSDRLMISAEEGDDGLRVLYRPDDSSRVVTQTVRGDLRQFIEFLARDSRPEDPRPGLGFDYSEVVGVLDGMVKGGALTAAFATETDKLQADIRRASSSREIAERPETASDEDVVFIQRPTDINQPIQPKEDAGEKPVIVPITPPKDGDKKEKKDGQ